MRAQSLQENSDAFRFYIPPGKIKKSGRVFVGSWRVALCPLTGVFKPAMAAWRDLLLADGSLHDGELWFDAKRGFPQESNDRRERPCMCAMKHGPTRLLFTGHDLGHPVDCKVIQTGLDFSEREKELFQSSEMGASALRELQRYAEVLNKVKERIVQELPVVESALKWGYAVIKT